MFKKLLFLLIITFLGAANLYSQTNNFISTFIGGSSVDDFYEPCVITGPDGYIYLTGYTSSSDFPTTPGAFDETFNGATDRFVCKFDPELQTLIASTFIGGSNGETGMGICFDNSGNIIIAGYSESTNFPTTTGSYDETNNGGYDAFVLKINNDLTTVLASTYLGGTNHEENNFPRIDVAVDSEDNIFVTGLTASANFPTTASSFDVTYNSNQDMFISKFDPDLTTLLASTYLGGSGDEWRTSILIDDEGNVYIGGDTGGHGYPTTLGAYDLTISKLNNDLSVLLASTLIGKTNTEDLLGMKLDGKGNIYLTGYTSSNDFPVTSTSFDNSHNSNQDGFVIQMDVDLTTILASSFLGGSNVDKGEDIVLGQDGNIYIVGTTKSTNFPVTNGSVNSSHNGSEDVFVLKMDSSLTNLMASSFIGGSGDDRGQAISSSGDDNIIIAGRTTSRYFPTTYGIFNQSFNGGTNDCFISKLTSNLIVTDTDEEQNNLIPVNFELHNNYPNPFNPSTTIGYSLPEEANITIKVFDILGKEIATLVNEEKIAGKHEVLFDASDISSGIYFYTIQAGTFSQTKKLMLIK